jgi:probable HAF family extracellular repeat protein
MVLGPELRCQAYEPPPGFMERLWPSFRLSPKNRSLKTRGTMRIRQALTLSLLFVAVSAAAAQKAPHYTYTIIDYPGSFNTGVFGINRSGQMSGTFFGSDGVARAFIYTDGKFSAVNYPKADRTFGFGINDAGSIVGYYIDKDNRTRGFLYDGKNFTTIEYPGATVTRANAINNSGDIAGGFVDSAGVTHGFVNKAGKFTATDFPGATRTEAYGINDAGWIVGYYADSKSAIHGFLDKAGVFTTVDYPGALRTNLYGVNKSGQIAGTYIDRNKNHGFINTPESVKLNIPGALSTFALALNDSGYVVGQSVDVDSVDHGFLAMPDKPQAPQISARMDPDWVKAGVNGFRLNVRGFGFVPGAKLQWNGTERPTSFGDDSNVTASIPPEDITAPGSALVSVVNPDGLVSNVVVFPIRSTPPP